MTRTALYRHFDASGALLYVGISNKPDDRTAMHMKASPWRNDVSKVTIDWLGDRRSALAAEAAAIQSEGPKHNRRKPAAKLAPRPVGGVLTDIFTQIDALADRKGITPEQVVRSATGNPRLYERLKRREEMLRNDLQRVLAYMASGAV